VVAAEAVSVPAHPVAAAGAVPVPAHRVAAEVAEAAGLQGGKV